MKTLVVYYSKTGNTKVVAEEIARSLGADIERIVETQAKRQGILGFLRSGRDGMLQRESTIATPKAHPSDYDRVLIGSPVWGWNLAPAVRSYLSSSNLASKHVGLFCTMGSSGHDKTFASMRALAADAHIVGELAIKQDELMDYQALITRIDTWLKVVRSATE